MKYDYTSFPLADTPYVAHLVPWSDLADSDKEEARSRFMATAQALIGHTYRDYIYICAPQGGVIGRRLI